MIVRIGAAFGLCVLALVLGLFQTAMAAESLDQLVAGAKNEGEVTLIATLARRFPFSTAMGELYRVLRIRHTAKL